MANHKSSEKRIRQTKKRRTANRYYAKTTRNAINEIKTSDDTTTITKELPNVVSMIDKLAKRGQIHKNKAANLKSKLMKKAKSDK